MSRTPRDVQREIATERDQLADAVQQLRGKLEMVAKLKARLPLMAAGLVLSGGTGAAMRFLARRSRKR